MERWSDRKREGEGETKRGREDKVFGIFHTKNSESLCKKQCKEFF